MDHLTIRYAHESDIPQILYFIKQLAIYENILDDVVATEELLREWIFEKKKAEVILAVEDGEAVGFACSSTTSPPSSDGPESTWKTCL